MKIYGSSLSPYVRKVLVALTELGIAFENTPTPPASPDPEFRETSPFGKIPGMRDGDFTLADSSAILAYIDALRPEARLFPVEARARARAVWFDEFGDTILFGAGQKMFFNRIVGPKFQKIAGDMAAADRAEREELPPTLDYLESILPPSGFLVEDRLTIADIAVASPMVNLLHLGIAVDAARYPALAGFVGRMFARPSFAALIEREQAFLARFV
jgi:glutathione S-transferase